MSSSPSSNEEDISNEESDFVNDSFDNEADYEQSSTSGSEFPDDEDADDNDDDEESIHENNPDLAAQLNFNGVVHRDDQLEVVMGEILSDLYPNMIVHTGAHEVLRHVFLWLGWPALLDPDSPIVSISWKNNDFSAREATRQLLQLDLPCDGEVDQLEPPHLLTAFENSNAFLCSLCKRLSQENSTKHRCEACDFRLCAACFEPSLTHHTSRQDIVDCFLKKQWHPRLDTSKSKFYKWKRELGEKRGARLQQKWEAREQLYGDAGLSETERLQKWELVKEITRLAFHVSQHRVRSSVIMQEDMIIALDVFGIQYSFPSQMDVFLALYASSGLNSDLCRHVLSYLQWKKPAKENPHHFREWIGQDLFRENDEWVDESDSEFIRWSVT